MKKITPSKFSAVMALFVALGLANVAFALKDDRYQEATLDADEFDVDLQTGVRIFRGNVVYTQGSIRLNCSELETFFNDEGTLDKAVCVGNPGVFKQRPEGKDTDMVAKALTITMDQVQNKVFLNAKAIVEQDGNITTGAEIIYDLINERASATGNPGFDDSDDFVNPCKSDSGRPCLVIQPRQRPAP